MLADSVIRSMWGLLCISSLFVADSIGYELLALKGVARTIESYTRGKLNPPPSVIDVP